MKRILAALATVLPLTLLAPISVSAAEVGNSIETASISAFSNGSRTLSAIQLSALGKVVQDKYAAHALSCTGIRLASEPSAVLVLAKARAKASCDAAKKFNPNLKITIATKTSKLAADRNRVALSFEVMPYPKTPLTLERLDINWVGRAAVSNVLNYFNSAAPSTATRTVVQGPNVPSGFAKSSLALLDKAARMFSSEYTASYTVVFFSERDGVWAEQKLAELGGRFPGSLAGYVNSLPSAKNCGFAFSTWDKEGAPIYYACLNTLSYKGLGADHTPIHEYFHFVQNTKYQTADTYIPLWVNEGPPVFFGFALAYGASDRANQSAQKFFGYAPLFDPNGTGVIDTKRISTFLKTATDAQIVSLYQQLELDPQNRDALNHYGFGGIAAEVLVAVYGADTYLNFLDETRYSSWQVAFEKTYGLSPTSFYEKLAPYVRAIGKKYF